MKRILLILNLLILCLNVSAQNKTTSDIITKTSGEQIEGDVKEVTDDVIRFSYTGETAVYNLNKSDIKKIQFKSGRIETFGSAKANTASGSEPIASTANHGNKVAVLPFMYIADGQSGNSEMSKRVQNACYAYLSKHAGNYSIMDVHATNAALAKAGITMESMNAMGMDELCDALGVAYVVTGMVTLDKTSQTSYGSTSQNSTFKKNEDKKKSSTSSFGSSYATTEQNYETTLDLNIYNDKGASVYNQNRKAFWHQQDAYKETLEYLLKRSPLYKK